MSEHAFHDILSLLAEKRSLSRELATRAFQVIMNGGATPAQMAAFLMGLRMHGETVDEITAGAIVLRAKAVRIHAPAGCIDTCGTGGDGKGTYNISTAVAFVIASCGVPVAKHGNRSISSHSGSSDVLSALGVKIDAEVPVLERCFKECNMAFLMAPRFHTAMRHVAPIRQELGIRTIFNILGPLANPAAPPYQVLGVYSPSLQEPFAHVLKELGTKAAWVVHGSDGLDELTITGPSRVIELKDGNLRSFEVTPEDAGLQHASLEELKGKNAEHNAAALQDAISGMESVYRNIVLYNAAAGLLVAEKVSDLKSGVAMAKDAIDSGRAHITLKRLVSVSNERA
jgi:anthranilate phosphoribosyltransferase